MSWCLVLKNKTLIYSTSLKAQNAKKHKYFIILRLFFLLTLSFLSSSNIPSELLLEDSILVFITPVEVLLFISSSFASHISLLTGTINKYYSKHRVDRIKIQEKRFFRKTSICYIYTCSGGTYD